MVIRGNKYTIEQVNKNKSRALPGPKRHEGKSKFNTTSTSEGQPDK